MMKKFKWLPLLFVMLSAVLVGCGDNSASDKQEQTYKESGKHNDKPILPVEKGVTYKGRGKQMVEIIEVDEWKVWGYMDDPNERYSLFKVEQTEYSRGNYSIVKISRKQERPDQEGMVSRPFPVNNEPVYCRITKNNEGFYTLKLGSEGSLEWKDFKRTYDTRLKDGSEELYLENMSSYTGNAGREDKFKKR